MITLVTLSVGSTFDTSPGFTCAPVTTAVEDNVTSPGLTCALLAAEIAEGIVIALSGLHRAGRGAISFPHTSTGSPCARVTAQTVESTAVTPLCSE